MDRAKAEQIEQSLKGRTVGSWTIESLINNGKSAAVFKATDGMKFAAVKVFDGELIERFGDTVQLERIERELTLKGKGHQNMVPILDGGYDAVSGHYFVVMKYLPGANLKQRLADVPVGAIGLYVSQLASCAEYLESEKLVHRDIKPENIHVQDDFSGITLLDFGVLKLVGEPGITDVEGLHPFIGTLQYSSPEFLLREEDGTPEGWRALTFYQIGGVLHDLIMREPLFSEFTDPFARLVNAVQYNTPQIQSSVVPSYLVDLAKMCLLKDPKVRLDLLDWDSFRVPKSTASGVPALKERVTKRILTLQAQSDPKPAPRQDFTKAVTSEIMTSLKESVRRIRSENDPFPPLGNVVIFPDPNGSTLKVAIKASDAHAIPWPVSIMLTIEVLDADAKAVEISCCAHSSSEPPMDFENQSKFFAGIFDPARLHAALEEELYRIFEIIQLRTPEPKTWLELEANQEKLST